MKRIAFSLISAVLLSTAIAPLAAQAAPSTTQQQRAQSYRLSQAPSSDQQTPSALEQRRLDELDRNGNQGGSLNRPSPASPADVEGTPGTPSALEQRRLDELNRTGNQDGSLNRPYPAARTDQEPVGNVQMSRLQQMRLDYLNHKS